MLGLILAERETGADQAAFEGGQVGDANATAVEGRATAAAGGEFFFAQGIINNGVFQPALGKMGDGRRAFTRLCRGGV